MSRAHSRLAPLCLGALVLALLAGCGPAASGAGDAARAEPFSRAASARLSSPPPPAGEGRFELVVLGVAQDGGLPHLGCARECCESARRAGRFIHLNHTNPALHDDELRAELAARGFAIAEAGERLRF